MEILRLDRTAPIDPSQKLGSRDPAAERRVERRAEQEHRQQAEEEDPPDSEEDPEEEAHELDMEA